MFSSKERLTQRTGKNSIGRYDFLKLLAIEYKTTKSKDAKEQVLANLANFAYDPINYGYMRQLQIIDIFLDTLSENNQKLVCFAIGGICNLCLDAINKIYILRNRGVELVSSLLSSQNEDIVLSAISTLMFLITLKFAELTGDYNPIHTESARNIVHGALLNGLVSGLIGTKLPGAGTIVIEQNLAFPKPCYAGDSVEVIVKIISVRKIIKCIYMCIANGDKIVLEGEAKLMRKILTRSMDIYITDYIINSLPINYFLNSQYERTILLLDYN